MADPLSIFPMDISSRFYPRATVVFNSRERKYYIKFLDSAGTNNPLPADAITIPADARGAFHLAHRGDRSVGGWRYSSVNASSRLSQASKFGHWPRIFSMPIFPAITMPREAFE